MPATKLPKGIVEVPNPKALQAVRNAKLALGTPYVYGGTQFGKGVDCSGLVYVAYRMAGVNLPRTSEQMYGVGSKIPHGQEIPGDLVFSYMNEGGVPGPGHVVMSIGNKQVIAADHAGTVVHIEPQSTFDSVYVGSRRPVLASGALAPGVLPSADNPFSGVGSAVSGVENAFSVLTDFNTWIRIGKFLAGAVLVVVGFLMVSRNQIPKLAGV